MKKIIYIFILLFLSVLIVWEDFFTPGKTFFLLDSVFYPIDSFVWFFDTTLFWHLNSLCTIVFGYILYSKIFFFSTVFFSGYLGLLLSQYILKSLEIDIKYPFIADISGILFFLFNPFFYERMITQPGVYLAILWFGYGFYFLLKNIEETRLKNSLLAGLFFGLSITLSPHTIFMIALMYVFYWMIYIRDKQALLSVIYTGGITILLNLNWIIGGFIYGKSNIINNVGTFTQSNVSSFVSNSISPLNVEWTNALLYGFWWERYWHLMPPNLSSNLWIIAGFVVLSVVFSGLWKMYQRNYRLWSFLILLGSISFVLAIWTASRAWWFFVQFLYDHLPYYIGLREPQKWIWVVMIIYGIAFVVWISLLFSFLQKKLGDKVFKISSFIAIIPIFLLLQFWSPNELFGFRKQLWMSDFPKDYFSFQEQEKAKKETSKYLVLPWHSYMGCNWTRGRILPNVMWEYFRPLNAIAADNIEIWWLYSNSISSQSKDIEKFLETKDSSLLIKHNIKNIILLDKCADFPRYDFLKTLSWAINIYSWESLRSYKISSESIGK